MNQPHRVNINNNNSGQYGYYLANRRNVMSGQANFSNIRAPVNVPAGNRIYTESEKPNAVPNRNTVYRGGERNITEMPSSSTGNMRSSNYSYTVTSSVPPLLRSHERSNAIHEEFAKNQAPKRNYMVQTSTVGRSSSNTNINNSKFQKTEEANSDTKPFGSSPGEKLCMFTGTVEKLIHWNKILAQNNLCYYEVIATMVSLREGSVRTQKIMLLRNTNGPILQVVYYTVTHIDLDDFHLGKIVRCVGYMTGYNILNAFSIRGAKQEEIDHLQRFTLISDQAVSFMLK